MIDNFTNKIKSQFPSLYHESGKEMVEFVEAYYEYVEEKQSQNRNMFTYNDIDDTVDDFVVHFKEKYLRDFPFVTSTDNRFLVKHIIDFYRSKGSEKSIKLLLRLLFNEDAELYYPSNDILKVSDSKWFEPTYIELTRTARNVNFVGKRVRGSKSKASAYVESVITKRVYGKLIDVVYISDLHGDFKRGETVTENGVIEGAPKVTGSLSKISIDNGGLAYKVGDILNIVDDEGVHGQVRVSETYPATNRVDFKLVDGGWGSTTSNATSLSINPRGTGGGATFKLGGLQFTETANLNMDIVAPMMNVAFNAATYGFTSNTSANSSTPIQDALRWETLTLGQITHLAEINPGDGYNADVDVVVDTPAVSAMNIKDQAVAYNIIEGSFQVGELVTQDNPPARGIVKEVTSTELKLRTASFNHRFQPNAEITGHKSFGRATVTGVYDDVTGGILGRNVVITGNVRNANGLVSSVEVVDSGFGYTDGKRVTMVPQDGENSFVVQGKISVDTTGRGKGFWQTTSSHLNSEKKIRDNRYYQEFSYEVVAKLSLDKYQRIFKDLVHVAGTEMFGRYEGVSDLSVDPQGYFNMQARSSVLNRHNANSSYIILDFNNGEMYNNGDVYPEETLRNK